MEQHITEAIGHMAKAHEELARILEAGRDICVHMCFLIENIPDMDASFISAGRETITEQAGEINTSVSTYLNSIGDLQEAAANNLGLVMKELKDGDAEE